MHGHTKLLLQCITITYGAFNKQGFYKSDIS